jgi:hypothetical protein
MIEHDLSRRGGWYFHEKLPITDPLDYFAEAGGGGRRFGAQIGNKRRSVTCPFQKSYPDVFVMQPAKMEIATMTPDRWTARCKGASNAKCVRAEGPAAGGNQKRKPALSPAVVIGR